MQEIVDMLQEELLDEGSSIFSSSELDDEQDDIVSSLNQLDRVSTVDQKNNIEISQLSRNNDIQGEFIPDGGTMELTKCSPEVDEKSEFQPDITNQEPLITKKVSSKYYNKTSDLDASDSKQKQISSK